MKLALEAPPAMVIEEGIVTRDGLPAAKLIVYPPVGAGGLIVTVALEVVLPPMVAGARVRDVIVVART